MTTPLLFAVLLQWELVGNLAWLGGSKIYCKTDASLPVATLDVGKETQWDADKFLVGQPIGRRLFFTVKAYNTQGVEGKESNVVTYMKTAEIK